MIKAVVFDLDDTLYSEIEYVKSGFRSIADDLNNPDIYNILWDLFKADKKNVYQRAGFNDELCKHCISIYRNHMPTISLPEESKDILDFLKGYGIKLGIITDGRPEGQHNKIKALGLDKLVDEIIVTDELGGIEYRKPNKTAFKLMSEKLNVEYDEMIYVGDNPEKDFYIGSVLPITTVRLINSGIYGDKPYLGECREHYKIDSLEELNEYIISSDSYNKG